MSILNFREELDCIYCLIERQVSNRTFSNNSSEYFNKRSEMLDDVFHRHIILWDKEDKNTRPYIWEFLGISLEEYCSIVETENGLDDFFSKMSNRNISKSYERIDDGTYARHLQTFG